MRNIYTYILSVVILLISLFACTDDYFEDETNLRIYIPEIEAKTINNVCIFLYDSNGHLIKKRFSTYPFDEEPYFINRGIVRFSVPRGTYYLSCFANTKNDTTVLDMMVNSRQDEAFISLQQTDDSTMYRTPPALRKIINRQTEVKPIGASSDADTIHLSEEKMHVGKIKYIFNGLPSLVQKIDVYATGLSTRLYFDGKEAYGDKDNEVVYKSAVRIGDELPFSFEDFYFPSITNSADKIALDISFLDNNSNKIGVFRGELNVLDEYGLSVPAVLQSNKVLTIVFDGFFLSGVSLNNWGDINTGDVTPM